MMNQFQTELVVHKILSPLAVWFQIKSSWAKKKWVTVQGSYSNKFYLSVIWIDTNKPIGSLLTCYSLLLLEIYSINWNFFWMGQINSVEQSHCFFAIFNCFRYKVLKQSLIFPWYTLSIFNFQCHIIHPLLIFFQEVTFRSAFGWIIDLKCISIIRTYFISIF